MNEEIMTNEMNEEVIETANEVEVLEPDAIDDVVADQDDSLLGKLLMVGVAVGAGALLYANKDRIKAWKEKRAAKKLEKEIAKFEKRGYVVTKRYPWGNDADDDVEIEEVEEVLDETEENE